eukprot:scaffold71364_cov21-Tisochrysis_lutea.AAC.1
MEAAAPLAAEVQDRTSSTSEGSSGEGRSTGCGGHVVGQVVGQHDSSKRIAPICRPDIFYCSLTCEGPLN